MAEHFSTNEDADSRAFSSSSYFLSRSNNDETPGQAISIPDDAPNVNKSHFVSLWILSPAQPGEYSLKIVFYFEARANAHAT